MQQQSASEELAAEVRKPKLAGQPARLDAEQQTAPLATSQPANTAQRMASPSAKTSIGGTDSDMLSSQKAPQLTTTVSGPRKIQIGQPSKFHVALSNVGAVEARDVLVSVSLPPWAELASKTPSTGATRLSADGSDSRTLEWQIQQMGANSSQQLELEIVPRENKPIELAVRWTVASALSRVVVEVQEAKLMLTIAGPDQVLYGDTQVYEMTVSNPGTGPAENVVINLFPLDGGANPAASHPIGTLKAGESKNLEIELTAAEAGSLAVKAAAVAEAGLRFDAEKNVTVLRPSLVVKVVAPKAQYAGTVTTYQVRVSNPGTAEARNVAVTAALPVGAKFLSGSNGSQLSEIDGKVSWNIAGLKAGEERVLNLSCELTSPGQNRLQIAGRGDLDLADETTAVTEVITMADLKLEVTDPLGPVAIGSEAVYEIRISNRGSKSAEAVQVSSFFSTGVEPVRVEGLQHTIGNDGQVMFQPIASIAAGSEVVLTIRAKAGRAGSHVFRAEVQCASIDVKLSAEETTHFYGEDLQIGGGSEVRTATRPKPITPQVPTPGRRPLQ